MRRSRQREERGRPRGPHPRRLIDQAAILATALPGHEARSVTVIEAGWDSVVLDVDDEWIVRVARRERVARTYGPEARLLAELAPILPVRVPEISLPAPDIGVYPKIRGVRADTHGESGTLGAELARFLLALHAFPVERAEALGVGKAWRPDHTEDLAPVLTLLDGRERERGKRLLEAYEQLHFEPVVTHDDLGPEHVLCADDRITGVIDWGDAGIGDAAIDLVWGLFDAAPPFRDALAAIYGVDAATASRAAVFWRLVPWHDVGYGVWTKQPDYVERGLAEVRARLPGAADDPDTMPR